MPGALCRRDADLGGYQPDGPVVFVAEFTVAVPTAKFAQMLDLATYVQTASNQNLNAQCFLTVPCSRSPVTCPRPAPSC